MNSRIQVYDFKNMNLARLTMNKSGIKCYHQPSKKIRLMSFYLLHHQLKKI